MCIVTYRIAAEVATKNLVYTEVSDLTKSRRRKFLLIQERNLTKRSRCFSCGQRMALFNITEAKCCVKYTALHCTVLAVPRIFSRVIGTLFQSSLLPPSSG